MIGKPFHSTFSSWAKQPLFGNDDGSKGKFSNSTVTALMILFVPILLSEKARRFLKSRFARYELLLKFNISKKQNNINQVDSNNITVQNIYIYPVKSTKAVSLDKGEFDAYGLKHDRRFMVVRPCPLPNKGFFAPNDATHRFVTQRQAPSLATISASLPTHSGDKLDESCTYSSTSNYIELSQLDLKSGQRSSVTVDFTPSALQQGVVYRAGLWDDIVEVVDLGDPAAIFLQKVCKFDGNSEEGQFTDVRLVYMAPKSYVRHAPEKYTPLASLTITGKTSQVSLSDGFPILIVSEASLQELNSRLIKKDKPQISMDQFRPNIVIRGEGMKPFEEDTWKVIRINNTLLHIVKGCPRCKQSCINQTTGLVSDEPLTTLKEFRALGKSEDVFFCQNALVQDSHRAEPIRVGDVLQVIEYGNPIFE